MHKNSRDIGVMAGYRICCLTSTPLKDRESSVSSIISRHMCSPAYGVVSGGLFFSLTSKIWPMRQGRENMALQSVPALLQASKSGETRMSGYQCPVWLSMSFIIRLLYDCRITAARRVVL